MTRYLSMRAPVYTEVTSIDKIPYDTIVPSNRLLVQVGFELYGNLSGVYFTRYATEAAERLGIKGWIMVNKRGKVMGHIQGEKDKVDQMAHWLRLQGSPGCRIDHAEFKNWQIVDSVTYRNFQVRF